MVLVRGSKVPFLLVVALAFSAVGMMVPSSSQAAKACPAPAQPLKFAPQKYIDMTRAGGEPTVEQHPDGTLMYGSHAGATHFYTPAAPGPATAAARAPPPAGQPPAGPLMSGSHAGTTHFYTPAAPDPTTAAFVENYTGQTY